MGSLFGQFASSHDFLIVGYLLPGHLELVIIAFIALLLFGHRLPGLMKSLGTSINQFKRGMSETDEEEDEEEEVVKKPKKKKGEDEDDVQE